MTQTQSTVRLASPADEPELLHLTRIMHAEGGMRRLDMERVREMYSLAFDRRGGVFAVIGAAGHIRAMMFLRITSYWYTYELHLEEIFNWVHPDHRRSDYAKIMSDYAKKWSDDLSAEHQEKIPLLMGVLTNKRMSAKVRLYRRFFGLPYGAFFVYNAPWVSREDVCEEDIWRMPSVVKAFFKREQRHEAKEKARVRA